MDKVQFQLESTLPELKDLHEKGLFSRVSLARSSWRWYRYGTAWLIV
jgi:U3 small nucleolar RNA-associated protein 6